MVTSDGNEMSEQRCQDIGGPAVTKCNRDEIIRELGQRELSPDEATLLARIVRQCVWLPIR